MIPLPMPEGLTRIYGFGHLHFLTFSCYRRLPFLNSPDSRDIFLEVLGRVRERHGFKLVGHVVMPEHVHMLVSEPVRGTPSTVLQVIKQDVSRLVQQTSQRRGSPFWQRRFYDFNVWTRKKKVEKLAYMHMNPVKRGLVAHPRDWPWSSYAFYEGKGHVLIGIDRVD